MTAFARTITFLVLLSLIGFLASCQDGEEKKQKAAEPRDEVVERVFEKELAGRFRSLLEKQTEVSRLIADIMGQAKSLGANPDDLSPSEREALAELSALQLQVIDDYRGVLDFVETHSDEAAAFIAKELLPEMKGSKMVAVLSGNLKSFERNLMFQASVVSGRQGEQFRKWLIKVESRLGQDSFGESGFARKAESSSDIDSSPGETPDGWSEKGYCIGIARISPDHARKSNGPSVQIGKVAYLFRGDYEELAEKDLGKKIKVTGKMVEGRLPMFIQSKDWKGAVPQGIPMPPGTDLAKESRYFFIKDPQWEIVEE
jgi:hypothetical protein